MTERRKIGAVRLVLFTVMVSLLALGVAEAVLRRSQRYATATELAGRGYVSPRDTSRFRVPWIGFHQGLSTSYQHRAPEFTFQVSTNSMGVRDQEHPVEKPPGEFRVVALGDSFTASHGVEWADGWTEVLERRLTATLGRPARVVSGGIPGHDPVFSYQMYRLYLRRYQPDVVLLVVNSSDVHDLVMRGLLDRFDDAGFVKPPGEPVVERLARYSHLVRAVVISMQEHPAARQTLIQIEEEDRLAAQSGIVAAAGELRRLVEEDEARFLLVSHPHTEEVRNPRSSIMSDVVTEAQAAGMPVIDLAPHFVEVVDPATIERWFFPVDGHCTKEGYSVFADAVLAGLKAERLLPAPVEPPPP